MTSTPLSPPVTCPLVAVSSVLTVKTYAGALPLGVIDAPLSVALTKETPLGNVSVITAPVAVPPWLAKVTV